jgi:hypothetical protein
MEFILRRNQNKEIFFTPVTRQEPAHPLHTGLEFLLGAVKA